MKITFCFFKLSFLLLVEMLQMGIGGPTQTAQLNDLQDVQSEVDVYSRVLADFNQIQLQLLQLLTVVGLQEMTNFLQSMTQLGQLQINRKYYIKMKRTSLNTPYPEHVGS